MAGNKAGGLKAKQKMIEKYGSEDAYREHIASIGRRGGKNGFGPDYKGGFAGDRELARRAGKIGGFISRRKAKIEKDINDTFESGILG